MNVQAYKKIANEYLKKQEAECSHIEYKKSELQLDKILKTLCAYGNNYYDNDYSFIYIGVDENNNEFEKATPKLPIEGLIDAHLEKAKNTLNSLRRYLYPNVKFDLVVNEFEGSKYLLIVVEKQSGGPFQVTEKALSNKKINLKPGRYIRIDSDSRLAKVNEEYELLRKFSSYHFSSDVNLDATIDDIDYDYLREYMSLTSKRSFSSNLSKKEIAESLNLFDRNETTSTRVKNYAILMFSKNPEQFIPYSSIEIITDTLGSTRRMEAKSFTGPIWKQYYAALKYMEDNYLRTITVRKDNIATNETVSNYPFKAVEELLANAIVHKNYESGKNIQVYVTKEQINIINYNRPLPPITIDDLNKRSLFHERDSVNPEIRDMFKALGIIESYGTGVGEAKKACEENGSSMLYYKEFEDNADITSVVLPISQKYCELINQKIGIPNKDSNEDGQIRQLIRESSYPNHVRNNLDKIYLEYAESVFSSKNIVELLHCASNTATTYLSKLLLLGVIVPVTGLGKGKYKFIEK